MNLLDLREAYWASVVRVQDPEHDRRQSLASGGGREELLVEKLRNASGRVILTVAKVNTAKSSSMYPVFPTLMNQSSSLTMSFSTTSGLLAGENILRCD